MKNSETHVLGGEVEAFEVEAFKNRSLERKFGGAKYRPI
jgi:hypothetical protein